MKIDSEDQRGIKYSPTFLGYITVLTKTTYPVSVHKHVSGRVRTIKYYSQMQERYESVV